MIWKSELESYLSEHFNEQVEITGHSYVGGGSINEAFKITTSKGDFFVKKNHAAKYPGMFEKESAGIDLLRSKQVIDVPEVILTKTGKKNSYFIMQVIETGQITSHFWNTFAKSLSELHSCTNHYFGLDHDNYIGSLKQYNDQHDSWHDFFQIQRIEVQVKLARDNGGLTYKDVRHIERFYKRLDSIFPNEPPSLLHGDLWSGNFMINKKGNPVIIDPAVYYGHREMDIAMTMLFGGFDRSFYNYYNEHFAMEKGWEQRVDYCNLYPLLVHVNLFGGGYINSVRSIIRVF